MSKATPTDLEQELRDFSEILRGRRTTELFLQTPVPPVLVDKAIEAATWAPNHHLTEPWHFYVFGHETKQQCFDLCRDIVAAKKGSDAGAFKRKSWSEKPGWLAVSCRRSDDDLLQQENYAACAAAIQNFSLYLWKAGVGMKWTSGEITRDARFFEIVGLDETREFVVGLICYGYPKLTPTQSRKGLREVKTELP